MNEVTPLPPRGRWPHRVGESSQSFKVVLPEVNVSLSEHWQRFVAEQVRSGRFPSEAAVLEKAIALLKQQERGQAQQKAPNGTGADRRDHRRADE